MNTPFTSEDLQKFSAWEPVTEGYDRNCSESECLPLNQHIFPVVNELKRRNYSVHHFEKGGLTNYSAFACYPSTEPYGTFEGITVYQSLLSPYASWGRAKSVITPNYWAYGYLGLVDVLSKKEAKAGFEKEVLELVETTPYQFLEPEILSLKLPHGVEPFEYCLDGQRGVAHYPECNRVFHVMFSNTD